MNIPFLDLKKQFQELEEEIVDATRLVLSSGSWVGGKYVEEFENKIADYLGCKHVIGCANGTDALVLALRACNVHPGDEVITTPFTFFATAEAIASIGAIPVFVDIKESDYNIDPALIEAAITDKTKVILPVHIFGAACDMDAIQAIAQKHNLKVIEDTAQGIGATYKGKKLGTLGDVGCFSFYPTKNLGCCGDGGMVTTNDDDLCTVLKAMREHGAGKNGARAREILDHVSFQVKSTEEQTDLYDPYKYYNYLIGYNSRLDALQAAILTVKLKHLDSYNARRAFIAQRYFEGLNDQLKRPQYDDDNNCCWHQFVVRSDYKNELCRYLTEHGVGNGTFYPVPLHRQKAFHQGNCKNPEASLPVAEKVSAETVCLPIFSEMTEEQIQYVIETVNAFYEDRK